MLLKSIQPTSILSYGPDTTPVELQALNVLIGPNGSGKSNLVEVVGLLAAASRDIRAPVQSGGGLLEWTWKGGNGQAPGVTAVFETLDGELRYDLRLGGTLYDLMGGLGLREEITELGRTEARGAFAFRFEKGTPVVYSEGTRTPIPEESFRRDQSVLAQLRAPGVWRYMFWLSYALGNARLYRQWSFGRSSPVRTPQPADAENVFLAEDASNLALVLNALRRAPDAKERFLVELRRLYDGIVDFDVQVQFGTAQVYLQEGRITVPASRLSDGTLHYPCLLAVLCHPNPPPLVCLEEPELGLHPDVLPGLADLLRDASERTQLIVTTHSDVLVDALSATPDAVLVCEKQPGGTSLRRLSKTELESWLKDYSLGHLWRTARVGTASQSRPV